MKCNFCNKIFVGDDLILDHFHHFGDNHYDVLTDVDKIMYDTRKKMIESNQEYKSQKQNDGDSDLVFNSHNSKV